MKFEIFGKKEPPALPSVCGWSYQREKKTQRLQLKFGSKNDTYILSKLYAKGVLTMRYGRYRVVVQCDIELMTGFE